MKKLSEYYINLRISVKKFFTQHAIRSLLDKISWNGYYETGKM